MDASIMFYIHTTLLSQTDSPLLLFYCQLTLYKDSSYASPPLSPTTHIIIILLLVIITTFLSFNYFNLLFKKITKNHLTKDHK